MKRLALLASALLLAAACGSSQPDNANAGPYACGKVVCQTGELCVHACCGGAPPQCIPKPGDGGACPAGFTADSCGYGQGGCRAAPCTPPEPHCAPAPDCGPDSTTTGRDVSCICA